MTWSEWPISRRKFHDSSSSGCRSRYSWLSRKTRNKRNYYPLLRSSKSHGTSSSAARPESHRSSSSDCRGTGCCCSRSSSACSMTTYSSWMMTDSKELVSCSPALCDADPSLSCWPYSRVGRSRVYVSRAAFCSSPLSCNIRRIDTEHQSHTRFIHNHSFVRDSTNRLWRRLRRR